MNREYHYSELMDDYLTGKLSEKQKLEFEEQLQKDPVLKKDFLVQRDIIEGIRGARKAELKSMLNNVNVGAGNGFNYFPLQIAGALLVTSMLAVGTYQYFSGIDEELADTSPVFVEPTPPINGSTEALTQEQLNSTKEENIIAEPGTISEEDVSSGIAEINEPSTTPEASGEDAVASKPSDSVNINESVTSDGAEVKPGTNLNVETRNRKHAFHYQYYEDKLFLYGDFKGSTYEILKLPTPTGTKLYMSYNGQFYKMEKSRKIQAFEPVEDPVIIDQLQKIRTK